MLLVAVDTADGPLLQPMPVGLVIGCPYLFVTVEAALVGAFSLQKRRLPGIMNAMAVGAGHPVPAVQSHRESCVFARFAVTQEAAVADGVEGQL